MGLADRDYMRDVPVYRELSRRNVPSRGVAVAATVSLGVVLLGGVTHFQIGRSAPVGVGLSAPRTYHVNGPTQVAAGAFMTATGTLPPHVSGVVILQARWRDGAWMTLATTESTGNAYRLRYQLAQPGTVDVRVLLPNGDIASTTITVEPNGGGAPSA